MSARTFHARRSALVARVGALLLDSILIAYALWCLHYLGGGAGKAWGVLDRTPGLVLAAPLLAVLWQATCGSLGMRGYRLELLEAEGTPADRDRRLWWGLLAGAQVALVLAPFAWAPDLPTAAGVAIAAAALFGAIALFGDALLTRLTGMRLARPGGEDTSMLSPWYARINPWIVIVLLGLTFAVGVGVTQVELAKLFGRTDKAERLVTQLVRFDWSITNQVVEAMIETVFLAMMASVLALPFAGLLGFLGARNLMKGSAAGSIVYSLVRLLMNVTRSIEPLVWAIIFSIWVGVGPFAGMLALFIHSVAALGKLYSEAVESIDPGPVEAIRATGANVLQVLRYGVLPQVVPPFLSFTVYRWDINVRMATILGLVGGGGIGALLINYQQMGIWPKVGTILVFITLVVWILDLISARARERLN